MIDAFNPLFKLEGILINKVTSGIQNKLFDYTPPGFILFFNEPDRVKSWSSVLVYQLNTIVSNAIHTNYAMFKCNLNSKFDSVLTAAIRFKHIFYFRFEISDPKKSSS